jgi:hypothetical protein
MAGKSAKAATSVTTVQKTAAKTAAPKAASVQKAELAATLAASFQNLGIEWKTKADGSAELVLAYEGPLAARSEVFARTGTQRQGSQPWTETSELAMKREGSRWVGAIPFRAGAPVEAVEFVFRAGDEWDNGGRAPLGYYEWTPAQGRVDVR